MQFFIFFILSAIFWGCAKEPRPQGASKNNFKGEVLVLRKFEKNYVRLGVSQELMDTDLIYFKNPESEDLNFEKMESDRFYNREYVVNLQTQCRAGDAIYKDSFVVHTNQFSIKDVIPSQAYLVSGDVHCGMQLDLKFDGKNSSYALRSKKINLSVNNTIFLENKKTNANNLDYEDFSSLKLKISPSYSKINLFCDLFSTELELEDSKSISLYDLAYSKNFKSLSKNNRDPRRQLASQKCLIRAFDEYGLSHISNTYQIRFQGFEPKLQFWSYQRKSNDRWFVYQLKIENPHEVSTVVVVDKKDLIVWMNELKKKDSRTAAALGFSDEVEVINGNPNNSKVMSKNSGLGFIVLKPGQTTTAAAWVGYSLPKANADESLGTPFYSLKKHFTEYESFRQITPADFSRKIPLEVLD